MICEICGGIIPAPLRLSDKEALKFHDPAFHVANAYHKQKGGLCIADKLVWPCNTSLEYTVE